MELNGRDFAQVRLNVEDYTVEPVDMLPDGVIERLAELMNLPPEAFEIPPDEEPSPEAIRQDEEWLERVDGSVEEYRSESGEVVYVAKTANFAGGAMGGFDYGFGWTRYQAIGHLMDVT